MYAMKDFLKYWLFTVIILLLNCPSINATNIVTYVVSDSIESASEKLKMEFESLSNEDDKVRISFKLKSANVPFTIYDAKWVNCDSMLVPRRVPKDSRLLYIHGEWLHRIFVNIFLTQKV